MSAPLPDQVTIYRGRIDGLLAERALLQQKLGQAVLTGAGDDKLAERVRTTDAAIDRARITLEAVEREAAKEATRAVEQRTARSRAALTTVAEAVAAKALAFEAVMLAKPVQAWLEYLEAQDHCVNEHQRLGRQLPASGFHRPARVWASVLSRYLREVGEGPVAALRASAAPKTLAELFGDTRPGASPDLEGSQ